MLPGVESPSGEFEQAAKLTDRCLFESGDDVGKGRGLSYDPGSGARPAPVTETFHFERLGQDEDGDLHFPDPKLAISPDWFRHSGMIASCVAATGAQRLSVIPRPALSMHAGPSLSK